MILNHRLLWGLICLMSLLAIDVEMPPKHRGLPTICGGQDIVSGLMSGL